MSYILEALQKSQRDRDMGSVPTIDTEQPLDGRASLPARSNAAVIIALVLALTAIVIAVFAVVGDRLFAPAGQSAVVQSGGVPASPVGSAVVVPSPTAGVASESVESSAGMAPGREEVIPAGEQPIAVPATRIPDEAEDGRSDMPVAETALPEPASPGGLTSIAVQPANPEPAVTGSTGIGRVEPESPRTVSPAPSDPAPSKQTAATAAVPEPSEEQSGTDGKRPVSAFRRELLDLRQQLERRDAAAAPSASVPVATAGEESMEGGPEEKTAAPVAATEEEPSDAAAQRPGTARDLPYGVFQRLPKRKVSVHVYARVPADRFIILNSRRMGEGESTREGLLIEEIFQDGVVFQFEDHRFFMPL